MGWVILAILAVATFAGLWLATRRRALIELIGAALLLAFAGYAWQGSPGYGGRPTPPRANARPAPSGFAQERRLWLAQVGPDAQVLDAADGLISRGDAAYAVGIIHAAIGPDPKNASLWIGYGNALVAYADGVVTPPARYAYAHAAELAPASPAPDYFLALAYAESGNFDDAAKIWLAQFRKAPDDAPWKRRVAEKLLLLAQFQQGANTR